MEIARHEARLSADPKRRAALELRAAQGATLAIEALTPPECPDGFGYLLDWTRELVGRSGSGMDGLSPLSWPTINAWAARTGRTPTSDECLALMQLDGVFRHPDDEQATQTVDAPVVAPIASWPSQKPFEKSQQPVS